MKGVGLCCLLGLLLGGCGGGGNWVKAGADEASAANSRVTELPGRSSDSWPLPRNSPSAIGRSRPPASFLTSAGARLMTTRSIGRR